MYPVASQRPPRGAPGFSMLELMIALAVLGVALAVGVPLMSEWSLQNKAIGAAEFYAEAFKQARALAVGQNAASRIVLTENSHNGQMDWQIDLCFPTAAVPCSSDSGEWSTTTAAAAGDPAGTGGYTSVLRSAASLPDVTIMASTRVPAGATDIYFTALGWVDTAFSPRLTRIELTPAAGREGVFAPMAVAVTLAGNTTKCNPTAALTDARACPP